MLEYYDKSDVTEGIDTNKTSGPSECIICHNWYFLKINLRYQPKICHGYYNITHEL